MQETMTNYSPLDWTDFFQSKRKVPIPLELDPTNLVFTTYDLNAGRKDLPVLVLVHGAGHCARSFAVTARELCRRVRKSTRILCPDLRGHGETTSDDQTNLDVDRLAQDLENLLKTLYGNTGSGPEITLVGHSMGGSIVTQVAYRNQVRNLVSISILDMLEVNLEPAMIGIRRWCEARPPICKTMTEAIQWGIESGTVHNVESARVSFPGMVIHRPNTDAGATPGFIWRTDLLASEQHWSSWFKDQNKKLLSPTIAALPKLLVLAGVSRLDAELTEALVQEKFEFVAFENAGHAVQEDDPVGLTGALIAFWEKNSQAKQEKQEQAKSG
ncbi:hypothetical protein BGX29_002717 [Mortierella sp. GBA35]|nr:hypothetical protein BGX29_002717 [Mortierella sp. GBA35]